MVRSLLPHGGSLPENDWRRRHRVIVALLWLMIAAVAIYSGVAHGLAGIRYVPELIASMACACLAGWVELSRPWRAVAASLGLLTAAASLIDISGGMIEMHFSFFVIVVILTLYEDWIPFLLAVGFVLLHHGVMGTIDPRAVFQYPEEWRHPWLWAGLHAVFVALAGVAGVVAWGLNENVRDRMRATQIELERIGSTDSLTGLLNRRRLMMDLEAALASPTKSALAIFDLDGFKDYNDRYGHPAGDQLLIRLTAQLSAAIPPGAHAYRLGGDEFCVLAPGIADEHDRRLVATWAEALADHGEGFSISASAGMAIVPEEGSTPSEALTVCDRRMYARKHDRRASPAMQTRDVLLAALAARHGDLGEHVNSVAAWSQRVGTHLGLSQNDLSDLRYAAELHDIGKVAIPDLIIGKPGPLNEQEFGFIRRHTVIGERILSASPALARVGAIVRSTHERFDGDGYPDALRGADIPLLARIIAVCDAFDAMTSDRPYRKAMDSEAALKEVRACAGGQFDPVIVSAFVQAVTVRPDPAPETPDGSIYDAAQLGDLATPA